MIIRLFSFSTFVLFIQYSVGYRWNLFRLFNDLLVYRMSLCRRPIHRIVLASKPATSFLTKTTLRSLSQQNISTQFEQTHFVSSNNNVHWSSTCLSYDDLDGLDKPNKNMCTYLNSIVWHICHFSLLCSPSTHLIISSKKRKKRENSERTCIQSSSFLFLEKLS